MAIAGIDPHQFWNYTLSEIDIITEAYMKKIEYEEKQRIVQAYLTARLTFAKKPPTLKSLLNSTTKAKKTIKPKEQTPEQQYAAIKAWADALGC